MYTHLGSDNVASMPRPKAEGCIRTKTKNYRMLPSRLFTTLFSRISAISWSIEIQIDWKKFGLVGDRTLDLPQADAARCKAG